MRKLSVFNHVTLDGYFTGANGDMSFAHQGSDDPEWQAFVQENAGGGGALLFGRVTYEMMAGFWPTAQARQSMPEVADRMNGMPKFVISRSLTRAGWSNTTLLNGDLVADVRRTKSSRGEDITILGSGSIVAQLAPAGLIDEYHFILNPVALGAGRTLFDDVAQTVVLKPTKSRSFRNGKLLLSYAPAG